MSKSRMTRETMAARVANEFQDGWIVNLGIGIPTLCSNYSKKDRSIIFQSENGVIGYGPMPKTGNEDLSLVNAGGQYVTLEPGAAIVNHAEAFALIRAGYIDVTVMGSYQVSANGDFANWKTAGRLGGGIGGAMDLAVGAKRVFVIMEHTTRKGEPRLLNQLTLPATARNVVKLVMTDLGLFDVTEEGFRIREIAPGFTLDEVQEVTEAELMAHEELEEVELV